MKTGEIWIDNALKDEVKIISIKNDVVEFKYIDEEIQDDFNEWLGGNCVLDREEFIHDFYKKR